MISDAIAMYDFLIGIKKRGDECKIISALFDWEGKLKDGSDKIVVNFKRIDEATWIYSINEYEDYIFIRVPVNMGCVIEAPGSKDGKSWDSSLFRYVKSPDGYVYNQGTIPNVKVDFMVIGYKPKQILELGKGRL